jgi:RHS repeat-associated protein
MTARPGQTLEWDLEGRVSKISSAAGDTTFVYDADGNRLIRRTAETTTLYLDGQELTLNRNTGGLAPTRYYTHGGKTVAVRTASNTLHWLLGDHQGTTEFSINADTMAIGRRRQAPFGVPRGAPADIPGDRGFVGGTEDASTGLVHIGAREYDADLGRFISVDPVVGSEPQLLNAYAYANNSPVTSSDPTGMYCDGCDYANFKYGDSSVWTPPKKRKSFCDSCEYYSNKYGTKSAWNQKYYGWKVRPKVFHDSKKLEQKRRAEAKRKADEEARRKAEEECGFWCGVGNRLKAVTSSPIFKWTGVALGVAGMFGCVVCGAISMGMSAVQTAVDCKSGNSGECAMGAMSLGLGAVAIGASKLAGSMWASGADIINKGAQVAQNGHRIAGAAVRGAGHVVQAAARLPMAQAFVGSSASLVIDTFGAAGAYKDLKL